MTDPVTVLVGRLKALSPDPEEQLRIAASTILDLSEKISYGFARITPYAYTRPPKPQPPLIPGPDIDDKDPKESSQD